jgi:hypothetical protein
MKPSLQDIIFAAILSLSSTSYALDVNGNGTAAEKEGLVSLYLFDEASGNTVRDVSGVGTPLNLTIDNVGAVAWGTSFLEITSATAIRSTGPATKIINACKGSNEITIEAWVESRTNNDLALTAYGPARIATLSTGLTKADRSPANVGFFVGQSYNAGHQFTLGANTEQALDGNALSLDGATLMTNASDRSIVRHSTLQHIHFIKDKEGNASIYVSDVNQVPILRTQMALPGNSSLANLDVNSLLVLANEPKYNNDANLPNLRDRVPNIDSRTIEDKDWRGRYYMLAVYCKALPRKQILGPRAPTQWMTEATPIRIDGDAVITPNRMLASDIYNRIAGFDLPIVHPTLVEMETALAGDSTNITNRMRAAAIASSKPSFYNVTVKEFAKKMSNRDETVAVPLNDFTATFIGITRDDVDARELLYGDFYYRGNSTQTAVPSDMVNDLIKSNRHYEQLEAMNYDLSRVLQRVNGQVYYDGANALVPARNYDAAGVLTSRAFLSEHAIAGTNRRLVEYSFQEFLCRPITEWADATAADSHVGRDVDRQPSGSHEKYQTSCRSCHAQMDGLRGAFSRITYETDFVKHAWVIPSDAISDPNEANNNTNPLTMIQVPRGISGKMNKNNDMFPEAKVTSDTVWHNYAIGTLNATYFGWKTGRNVTATYSGAAIALAGVIKPDTIVVLVNDIPAKKKDASSAEGWTFANGNLTFSDGAKPATGARIVVNYDPTPIDGTGIREYGMMLSESRAFSTCMAKKVFRSVCKREVKAFDESLIQRMAASFRGEDSYSLKKLFERTAVQPECLGQ